MSREINQAAPLASRKKNNKKQIFRYRFCWCALKRRRTVWLKVLAYTMGDTVIRPFPCSPLFVYDGTSSWPTFSPRFCHAEILGLALFFFLWLRWSLDKSFMFSISNGCVPPTLTQHFKIVASVFRWAWVRSSECLRAPCGLMFTWMPRKLTTSYHCLSLTHDSLSQPHVVVFFSLSPSHAFSWMPRLPHKSTFLSRRLQPAVCVFLVSGECDLHCHPISPWINTALAIIRRSSTILFLVCFCCQ